MFDKSIYKQRRSALKSKIKNGVLLFLSNDESPMNYSDNTFHYRQDSTFLYYFGLDEPNVNAIIDIDAEAEILFGDDHKISDIIWTGPQLTIAEKAIKIGLNDTLPSKEFISYLDKCLKAGKKIHYLPPYRAEHFLKLEHLLKRDKKTIKNEISTEFIKAVVAQRSIKAEEEISEIEKAHAITYQMHTTAMKMAKPGLIEREISGTIEGIAIAKGSSASFPVILSVHGETLHNHFHGNIMKDKDLLINDSGAESELHYAADITRTIPVGGKFTSHQKDIYEIVLQAQVKAIEAIQPGRKFLEIHKMAATVIVDGLKALGFMKGDTEQAVENGAHALFFPHGLGHMMGLDVHDMENLGEDYVGYDETIKRSDQFGLAYLRLAKELQSGHVVTVEPGIYFIPELIDLWKSENKFLEFINYDKVVSNKKSGGIRLEDDVLVTDNGYKIIGKTIPKTIEDVEEMC